MVVTDWPTYSQIERMQDSIDELNNALQKQTEYLTGLTAILNIAFADQIKDYQEKIFTGFVGAWRSNVVREGSWVKVRVDKNHTVKLYIKKVPATLFKKGQSQDHFLYCAYKSEQKIVAIGDTLNELAYNVAVALKPKLVLQLVQVINTSEEV